MSLCPETTQRIDHFRNQEEVYRPNHTVRRTIGSRALDIVVGPAAIGKSLIMNEAARLRDSYGRSSTLSTREPRPDDEPGIFRNLEHNDENINKLLDKILSGELVQYKFHPTENTFYGSEAQDHPYEHNMLPTLSGGINQLKQVGFQYTRVIGLVAAPSDWSNWFNARYPERHPQRLKRLEEAEISYSDLLLRNDVTWIINREGDPLHAARQLIENTGQHTDETADAIAYAHRILHLVSIAKAREESIKYE